MSAQEPAAPSVCEHGYDPRRCPHMHHATRETPSVEEMLRGPDAPSDAEVDALCVDLEILGTWNGISAKRRCADAAAALRSLLASRARTSALETFAWRTLEILSNRTIGFRLVGEDVQNAARSLSLLPQTEETK